MKEKSILLSTAYFPCIEYIKCIYQSDCIYIEKNESYSKQSYRNRTHITSSQGLKALSIPIANAGNKEPIFLKKISFQENWQQNHFRTIRNTYKNSPWFNFLEDEFSILYEKKTELLLDHNQEILNWILRLLKINRQIIYTDVFEISPTEKTDYRNSIHPKLQHQKEIEIPKYHQIFMEKNGFLANLSILDLIFSEGIKLDDYLKA